MAEQVTIPEPPDGAILFWPASDEDEAPVVMARVTPEPGTNPDARWVVAILREDPVTYAEASTMGDRYGYPMAEAQRMFTQAELDAAVVQAKADAGLRVVGDHIIEPGGWCRTDGTRHSPEEIARAEDRLAAEPSPERVAEDVLAALAEEGRHGD